MRRFLLSFLLLLLIAAGTGPASGQAPAPTSDPAHPSDAAKDPQRAFWLNMKQQLQGPNGKQYFELVLKNAKVPGAADGIDVLRGTVVGDKPAKRPSELVLAMSDDQTPEVTLTLRDSRENLVPLKKPIAPGTTIEFFGIPVLFTQNPFMLTFEVKAENGPGGPNPRFPRSTTPKK
jgi:hypothetical protein